MVFFHSVTFFPAITEYNENNVRIAVLLMLQTCFVSEQEHYNPEISFQTNIFFK